MSINGTKSVESTGKTPNFGIRCPNPKNLIKILHVKGGFQNSTAQAIVNDLEKIGSKETVLKDLSIFRNPKTGLRGVQMSLKTGLDDDKDTVIRKGSFVSQFFNRKEFVDTSKKVIDSAEEGYIKSRVLKGAAKEAIAPGERETEHSARLLSYIYPDKTDYIETIYKYAKVQPEKISKAKISLNA